VFTCLVGDGESAQHAGDLFGACGAFKSRDLRARGVAVGEFGHAQMTIAEGGNLRQVRDAEHLGARAEGCEFTTDDLGDGAADTRIDLIEHHAHTLGRLVAANQCHLHRE
jgi:hypothetical protein